MTLPVWAVALVVVGLAGWPVGVGGWLLARRWLVDCRECRIIIARKGRVMLDANLVEWLAWNKALPKREQSRGGVIFHSAGISVALARPKLGAGGATSQKTSTVKEPASESSSTDAAPAENRQARRRAARAAAQ